VNSGGESKSTMEEPECDRLWKVKKYVCWLTRLLNLRWEFGVPLQQKNHSLTYFNCRTCNNRRKERGQCDATHHIRTDFLEQVVLGGIKRIMAFAKYYEDDFLQIFTTGMGDEMEWQGNVPHELAVTCNGVVAQSYSY